MSFLAPLYLALVGAAAVPLLLHLLRRRIANRIEFPAARYLLRAERENSRQLKLRNLLLMILRVLAVLALALAAARPVGRLVGTGHLPTALAIVLDNSLSTSVVVDGAPLIARLQRAAHDVARGATGADRVWLVTADGRVTGGSAGTLDAAIDDADPLAGRGDLSAAIVRAAGLARGAALGARHVVVITDAQATALPEVVALGDVPVSIYAPVTRAPLNHAVVEAEARPVRWTPRGAVAARTLGADSASYRIAIAGAQGAPRTLARGIATGREEILVRAAPAERGWVAGNVELEPDELRGDDRRWFAAWIGAPGAVAIDASAGPFVRSAVDALVENERLRRGSDVSIVSADRATTLPALLIAPADPVRASAANRTLERLGVPWRFGTARRESAAIRVDTLAVPGMEGAVATFRYPLEPTGAASADTLATAGGAPWIVAGDRYVIVASPLDPAATTFPVRAGFVPWLGDVVSQRLSGDVGTVLSTTAGAPLHVTTTATVLEDASGRAVAFDPRDATAPERAGVYFLLRGGVRVGAIVVNAEPEESDLARLAPRELRARFTGENVVVSDTPAATASRAFASAARRPLIAPLLVLALLLLIAESLVSRGAGRSAPGVAPARAA